MIENGENGILIKPNNKHELANASSFLLQDNSKREYPAKNARASALRKQHVQRVIII
jgi:glycosyltransferase involved in cell wall biosynthesis